MDSAVVVVEEVPITIGETTMISHLTMELQVLFEVQFQISLDPANKT